MVISTSPNSDQQDSKQEEGKVFRPTFGTNFRVPKSEIGISYPHQQSTERNPKHSESNREPLRHLLRTAKRVIKLQKEFELLLEDNKIELEELRILEDHQRSRVQSERESFLANRETLTKLTGRKKTIPEKISTIEKLAS